MKKDKKKINGREGDRKRHGDSGGEGEIKRDKMEKEKQRRNDGIERGKMVLER